MAGVRGSSQGWPQGWQRLGAWCLVPGACFSDTPHWLSPVSRKVCGAFFVWFWVGVAAVIVIH